jgi:S1-C subfamily serine protease
MSIDDANELRNTIGLMSPGERVEIQLVRDGQRRRIMATLGTRPAAAASVPGPLVPPDLSDELTEGVTAVMARGPAGAALRVTGVDPESEAAARGLIEGDLITHINRRPVTSFAEAQALMRNARNVVLQVRRDDRDMLLILR